MANKDQYGPQPANIDFFNLEPCIAIISLRTLGTPPRTVYYQVTLDINNISPDKAFIRFGEVEGDEVHGWIPVVDVQVWTILHWYENEDKIPYKPMIEVS